MMLRVALTLLLIAAAPAAAQTRQPADQLIGLWAYEGDFGPSLRGPLSVKRAGRAWNASIAGLNVPAAVSGRDIRFAFAERGGFRGRVSSNNRIIEGFWLQPTGETADRRDPGGSGQPFATPMTLKRVGGNVWQGVVTPLDDRFTLYLKIFRDDANAVMGSFRNPQLNSNGGASRFAVERDGNAIRFGVKFDGGEIKHDATFVPNSDRIRIQWRDLERPIELSRRQPAQAASFFPRLPGSAPYDYRRPPETGDGWRTAKAAETGLAESALQGIVRELAMSDPTVRPPILMHSLLVAHRGRLVLEEYFFGYGRDTPHDTRSAGKTFSSVMLGAATREGANLRPESRITQVMRGMEPFANPDPRKDEITLAHLMTHSSGLACNDNDEASPGNEGRMQSQSAQPNWWKYTLDLPMAHDPGKRYAYCSANTNLVGGALTVGTQTWLPELFARTVARPLQFGRWHWNLMPTGEGYLGGGAFLRPRDMLKVGQTYLNGGTWNGRRIVDVSWVAESTRPRIEISEATTGYSKEEFGNYYGHGFDAWTWHPGSLTVSGRTVATYAATGNGGQVVLVVPEYELAVVFTGGNYMQGGVWSRWGQKFVGDRIIPAIAVRR